MGFIAGCLLLGLVVKTVWDLLFRRIEREKLMTEYRAKPLAHLFLVVWMTFFIMFFVGIFVPAFGEMLVTDSGWEVWEIGIIGFFGCWVVTWFIDLEKIG